MTTTANICQAKRKDGRPCHAFALKGSKFCFAHDPTKAAERRAARAKGGRARHGRKVGADSRPVAIVNVGDVLGMVERAVNDALKLENSIARARTIGYLAGIALKALEVGALEERVSALEQALQKRSGNEYYH